MNPLTNMKNVLKLSDQDLKGNGKTSWHDMYKGSAWIFVGGLPYDLTEGDILCIFSQYGEIVNINLIRDKATGKSKGYCFICFEDQRSTILTVDNLNGIKTLGRTLRVDHVAEYKVPKENDKTDEATRRLYMEGCGPKPQIAAENIKKEPNGRLPSPTLSKIRKDFDSRHPLKEENISAVKVETDTVQVKAEKKSKKSKKSKDEKSEKKNKRKDKKHSKKSKREKSSSDSAEASANESDNHPSDILMPKKEDNNEMKRIDSAERNYRHRNSSRGEQSLVSYDRGKNADSKRSDIPDYNAKNIDRDDFRNRSRSGDNKRFHDRSEVSRSRRNYEDRRARYRSRDRSNSRERHRRSNSFGRQNYRSTRRR